MYFAVRKSMLISVIGVAVGFVILGLAPNIYIAWLGFACLGTTHAFGQANACSAIMRNWVHKNPGRYMGLVLGATYLGTAIWPLLGGQFFTNLTLSKAFYICIPCFVIPSVLAILLLVKNKPEDAGVKPIGWDENTAVATHATNTGTAGHKRFNVYGTATFWICAVSMLFILCQTGPISTEVCLGVGEISLLQSVDQPEAHRTHGRECNTPGNDSTNERNCFGDTLCKYTLEYDNKANQQKLWIKGYGVIENYVEKIEQARKTMNERLYIGGGR